MRRAKFLGIISVVGGNIEENSMGGHSPGDVIVVFPNSGNHTYPWRDTEKDGMNSIYFREEELFFPHEKEFDPNDYL